MQTTPATMEQLMQAMSAPQAQQSAPPEPPAQKWPGEAGDAPQDDPAYEQIQSGVFDMSPDELDTLQQMIDEARARLQKQNPDPGGDITL
jgi:hypothetical protein